MDKQATRKVPSLRLKLAIICLTLSLAVSLTLYVAQLYSVNHAMLAKQEKDTVSELEAMSQKLDNSISSIRSLFYFISNSSEVQKVVLDPQGNAKRKLHKK